MIEDTININTASGVMKTFIVRPEGNKAYRSGFIYGYLGRERRATPDCSPVASQGYAAMLPICTIGREKLL